MRAQNDGEPEAEHIAKVMSDGEETRQEDRWEHFTCSPPSQRHSEDGETECRSKRGKAASSGRRCRTCRQP